MINYTFNNNYNDGEKYIALTDIPNIISVYDEDEYYGQTAIFTLSCNTTSLANQDDGTYYITMFGETITSVKDYNNAINKNFWISQSSNYSTAASICKALKNCQSLAANYNIYQNGVTVRLEGKRYFDTASAGQINTNISNSYLSITTAEGSDPSVLTNANVIIDVFSGSNEDYVTTLEKKCADIAVDFNISPVLTSIAQYGKTNPFSYRISYVTSNGIYNQLANAEDNSNYAVIGYMVNQGKGKGKNNQINATEPMIAQNVSRGDSNPSFINHSLLYLYEPTLPLSFFRGNQGGGSITYTYRDSAFGFIASGSTTWQSSDSNNKLYEITLELATTQETKSYFNQAFYIDVDANGQQLRYNVIKPLKAAEECTRIYFRNSYGGVSFIDLTGKRTETRNVDIKTYQKGIYDYQDSGSSNVLDVIYDNQVKYDVTIKSHLFEGDGRWIYNDLLQSSKIWVEVNGETYDIILDSVSVDEQDNSNNIYQATVKFRYSMNPSIL